MNATERATWTADTGSFADVHGNFWVPIKLEGVEVANAVGASEGQSLAIANDIANAMNAAPALLAACEDARRSLAIVNQDGVYYCDEVLSTLRAAIAAAKGG